MASRILSLFNCAGGGGGGGHDAKQRRKKKQQQKQLEKKRRKAATGDGQSSLEEAYRSAGRDSTECGLPQPGWQPEGEGYPVQIKWRTFNYLLDKQHGLTSTTCSLAQVHFTDSRPLRVRSFRRGGGAFGTGAPTSPPEPAVWCAFTHSGRVEARLVSLRPNSGGLQPGSCQPALVCPVPESFRWQDGGDGGEADGDRICNLESEGSSLIMQLGQRLYRASLSRLRQSAVRLMDDCIAFCCSKRQLFALRGSDQTLGCVLLRGLDDTLEEAKPVWRRRWHLNCLNGGNEDSGWHTLAHWPAGGRIFLASRTSVLALQIHLQSDDDLQSRDAQSGDESINSGDEFDEYDDGGAEIEAEDVKCLFRLPLAADAGGGPQSFSHVTDLAVDRRGVLFVCDRGAGCVHAFNSTTGRHVTVIGGLEFPQDVLLMNHLLPDEGLDTFRQPGLLKEPATLCVFQQGGEAMLLVSGGVGCACQTFDISRLRLV